MGYYDDHVNTNKKKNERGWLLPTIVGLVLGAVLILLALPALVQSNLLPYDLTVEENEDENVKLNQGQGDEETQTVNVNINSQMTEIVNNVSDAVVGVVNIKQQSIFGNNNNNQQNGVGSGVVYKKDDQYAYIVTNYHVIQGADDVEIAFSEDKQVEAEVLGGDLYTDLAVLRVDAEHAEQVIELGDSDNLKVGEPVLAIGNPLGLQFAGSVTQGIVSGKDRLIPQDFDNNGVVDWQAEVIQTDAAINPGNSGGALVNMDGQLIGINSMKYASTQLEGLGFAIPINIAKPIIDDLEQDGSITRSYMGVGLLSLTSIAQYHWYNTLNLPQDIEGGVIVDQVERMSPADQAGLERYDVIVQIDDTEVTNVVNLRQYLYTQTSPGEESTIQYYRDGELQETTIKFVSQGS
ncbi:S1C family serine protease [Tenuibacillus multivorans]|uniref:Serine protease Do n=1 Tax=Tenuibacillus multivorans TaxID=237069 RepID=A0A1G9W9B8_9BACI|nr:trypsin-like peptidase domain-containing protein [Tenuibacillus multivorans]GEL76355.1 putative serine protease YyxA [Tenuibacillus multivorans]SDM80863.1 serine protease Do [Tenuibacillus multivorans]